MYKPIYKLKVTDMKKYEDYTDEDIRDEITLTLSVMKKIPQNQKLTEKGKQIVIDDCLDNLNLLYNEQRKRGTFKENNDRA
jgi:hypothetical protein